MNPPQPRPVEAASRCQSRSPRMTRQTTPPHTPIHRLQSVVPATHAELSANRARQAREVFADDLRVVLVLLHIVVPLRIPAVRCPRRRRRAGCDTSGPRCPSNGSRRSPGRLSPHGTRRCRCPCTPLARYQARCEAAAATNPCRLPPGLTRATRTIAKSPSHAGIACCPRADATTATSRAEARTITRMSSLHSVSNETALTSP